MDVVHLELGDPLYPSALRIFFSDHPPKAIAIMGNLDILRQKKLALFCSVQCPGNLILQTYDLACDLRDAGVTVLGGFPLADGERMSNPPPARHATGHRLPCSEYRQDAPADGMESPTG